LAHVRFFIEKPDVYEEIVQKCRTGISFFFTATDAIVHLNPSINVKFFVLSPSFSPKILGEL
jgi:hypothetical protein